MEAKMAPTTKWMSMVKEEIKKSPLASNFCFGFILFCLEEIVDMEFACPCEPQLNCLLVAAFFIVPAVIVFLLMFNIQGFNYRQFVCEAFMHSAVPATVWLVLLLFDGRYIACAMTNWSGKYEVLENSTPQRWCNPFNSTQNEVTLTQHWYSHSQFAGIMLALVLTVMYQIYLSSCSKKETPNGQNVEATITMTDKPSSST